MKKWLWLLLVCIIVNPSGAADKPENCVSERVHAFYYPWYGNLETDGQWIHWNHVIYPEPGKSVEGYQPPEQIGANFYPAIGLYSSSSKEDIRSHLHQLRIAGVGVIAVSWWGKDSLTDQMLSPLIEVCQEYDMKICFHLEPYPGRDAKSVFQSLSYLHKKLAGSSVNYQPEKTGYKPLIYIYDSYLTPATDWAKLLKPESEYSIRGTELDACIIGLYVKKGDEEFMIQGGFDGFYTYFATDGFTYGSTVNNWKQLSKLAKENNLIFIPSVGPGYDDTRIRPWNTKNQRDRDAGSYYDRMFKAAIELEPEWISITSYNEWHEGTQIAPAVPKETDTYTYLNYLPLKPDDYLFRTRDWVEQFLHKHKESLQP